MLPCVGQGAIGLEIRENDERMADICGRLNDEETFQCVIAERALLMRDGRRVPDAGWRCMPGWRKGNCFCEPFRS